jgi:hypothetical protein
MDLLLARLCKQIRQRNGNPFVFDRRHNFNLVLNYTFCRIWDVGVRWQYGTGFPYTEPTGVKPRIVNGQIATRGVSSIRQIRK